MDPRSGEIYDVTDEAHALERGLVPLQAADVAVVKKMTLSERVKWLEDRSRLYLHPLGGIDDPDEQRKMRNALKAERRARRGR